MSESFVVVWRAIEGAAVQTYALSNKSPRPFSDTSSVEAAGAEEVGEAQLTALLESRDAFKPKRVSAQVAKALLGWDV